MVPWPQEPGRKTPLTCPWGKGGVGGCVLPATPCCVPAEPAPGGAEEAAPRILVTQAHPASGWAPPCSASTQAMSSPSVPPARLPGEHSAAQHGHRMHSCCVSMPAMGLAVSHLPETRLH